MINTTIQVIDNNIISVKFQKISELTLTFFRVQEYYESQNDKLLNKKFSVFDFISESITDDGYIDYFSTWEGFNIPGHIYDEWSNMFKYDELTVFERDLSHKIRENRPKDGKFYIIASLEDDEDTFDHELAHALYYLNESYQKTMDILTRDLPHLHERQSYSLISYLTEYGYNKKVFDDEIQAYLSTETDEGLKDPDYLHLKCSKKFKEYVNSYRQVFTTYKNRLTYVEKM